MTEHASRFVLIDHTQQPGGVVVAHGNTLDEVMGGALSELCPFVVRDLEGAEWVSWRVVQRFVEQAALESGNVGKTSEAVKPACWDAAPSAVACWDIFSVVGPKIRCGKYAGHTGPHASAMYGYSEWGGE
jgi:hypothetical protein